MGATRYKCLSEDPIARYAGPVGDCTPQVLARMASCAPCGDPIGATRYRCLSGDPMGATRCK